MKTKLRKVLFEKIKDTGLTDKAIDELVALGSEGLNDDSTDADLEKKAAFLVPFAKAMQGEITRKTKPSQKQSEPSKDEKEGEKKEGDAVSKLYEQFAALTAKIDALSKENADIKANNEKKARAALIESKAKELGIPNYIMKRVIIADDADYEKELTDLKQDLVTHRLAPKGSAGELSSDKDVMKKDAEMWAKSLPDKN